MAPLILAEPLAAKRLLEFLAEMTLNAALCRHDTVLFIDHKGFSNAHMGLVHVHIEHLRENNHCVLLLEIQWNTRFFFFINASTS